MFIRRFHPSRALLAVGTADGSLRVYDLSFAAAATAAAAAPAAVDVLPFIDLKDHISSITALTFLPAAAAASLQEQQQPLKGAPAARRKAATAAAAAAAAAAADAAFPGALVSAAADSLIDVWSLRALPHTAGLLLLPQQQQQQQQQQQHEDLQQLLQQIRRHASHLQRRLQQQQQKQQEQHQVLLQLPTLEIVTSLLVQDEEEGAPEGPLLLTGGAEGLVKIWHLKTKKILKVRCVCCW